MRKWEVRKWEVTVSGLDDVTSGGCLVLDVGLLEDSLRLPTEWFEDRDGLPALTGQQVWGVGTVEHVVAWVVDAGAEVDGEGAFGYVVGVQGLLGSERRSLAISELDHHRGSKGQEGLGRILVEDGLGLVEGPVRGDGSVEGGLSGVVELVGDEGLEVEDQGGAEAVW